MHVTGQSGIELSGCGWHSVVLDKTVDIAFEKDEAEKVEYFRKNLQKGKGVRFMPSLSNIFGDSHIIQRKADSYLPFDYPCADCIRSYVEFINYLLINLRDRFRKVTQTGKVTFLFPMSDYLFDREQEKQIFFYLEKLKESLDDEELKALLEEFIEYNKKELANV